MPHRIHQPTKEQVRAYMLQRRATRRHPPPSPEEIRRQLNWRLAPPEDERLRIQFFLIPTIYSHMALQIALDWAFAQARRMAARHH
jgi:hypothetical protein